MKIMVTGSNGLVGKSLQELQSNEHIWLFTTSKTCNLLEKKAIETVVTEFEPDIIFHLASLCGGFNLHQKYKVEFLRDNLIMNENLMMVAYERNIKRVFLMSSIITSVKNAESSYTRSYFYSKKILEIEAENYNSQYGTDFIVLKPCNLYGEHDRFDPKIAHVVPSLITQFIEAEPNSTLTIYGSPTVCKKFLFSRDLAKILIDLIDIKVFVTKNFVCCPDDQYTISDLANCLNTISEKNLKIKFTQKGYTVKSVDFDNTKLREILDVKFTNFNETLKELYTLKNIKE